jgi:arylsulfatase A-like enzyme
MIKSLFASIVFSLNIFTLSANNTLPNIILILVDDLGKEWISCYGAEDIATPNIDALAQGGILFNNVYSMPQCTPSRVTLLTGQYPFNHGWVNHWDVPRWGGGAHFDETMNPSLGLELKKAGYTTCIAGKWQIDDFRVEPDALIKNGFDEYCMWPGFEKGVPASVQRYNDPYVLTKNSVATYDGKFGPDLFSDFILSFIERNKENPFFIYYPMVLTHTPFVDTPDESAEDNLGKHKAMVRYADKITGKIVKTLENQGILDNTVIIWTTDNGTATSITGTLNGRKVKGGKSKTSEAGICAPFIISWRDQIKSGRTSDALIDFTDIFPTCLNIAGIKPEKYMKTGNTSHIIDGYSFMDVMLFGDNYSQRLWILGMGGKNQAKLTEKGVENLYIFRDRVLRNRQYKLYVNSNKQAEKFFDLVNDPDEMNNLIDSLNTSERIHNFQILSKAMENLPDKDNDPRYVPNPPQVWDVNITEESQTWKK